VKFGIMFANTGPYAIPAGAAALADAAERAGFDTLWTVEHVVVPQGYASAYPYSPSGRMPARETADFPDPLVWLAWVAARTTTIRLATGIVILPQRNPAVLAKEAATLDVMSGGRLVLGVGIGWLEEEFRALGARWEDRVARTEEYVAAMRSLWQDEVSTFAGETVDLTGAISRPRPVGGTVPIVIGGHSSAAARRAGRYGDGFFPAKGDLPSLLVELRKEADAHGRDPDAIEVTFGGADVLIGGEQALDAIGRLAEAGVSRLVIPPLSFDPAAVGDALASFGEEVVAKSG
jgi:probable F420-dependent oxidoreductase